MKGTSSSQTALPSVTYTASSVRRKSAPKINQPPSPVKGVFSTSNLAPVLHVLQFVGPDGKIVPPENLLSPHPHHKFHSLDRKLGTNKVIFIILNYFTFKCQKLIISTQKLIYQKVFISLVTGPDRLRHI